jgi:hypothetical protein
MADDSMAFLESLGQLGGEDFLRSLAVVYPARMRFWTCVTNALTEPLPGQRSLRVR